MKKFFMNTPLQGLNPKTGESFLQKFHYTANGNSRLVYDEKTRFPIIHAINGYVQPGEPFRVITVSQENNPDTDRNYGFLVDELKALCERRGFLYPACGVEQVFSPLKQDVFSQLDAFTALLDYFEDDDDLFACVTYGTKMAPITLLTALQYANRLKESVIIQCIVYGDVDRRTVPNVSAVYDVTALIQMDEITRFLANRGIEHPAAHIRSMLSHVKSIQREEDKP